MNLVAMLYYDTILYVNKFNRKPVSFITKNLDYLYFKCFQLTSRKLVSLEAIILVVCKQFFQKKQHFLLKR